MNAKHHIGRLLFRAGWTLAGFAHKRLLEPPPTITTQTTTADAILAGATADVIRAGAITSELLAAQSVTCDVAGSQLEAIRTQARHRARWGLS